MATWSILVILGRSGLFCPEAEGQRAVMEESKHVTKEKQIPRFARDDTVVDFSWDNGGVDAREDTVVDSARNDRALDFGARRSGIGSSAGFYFANFVQAGAEARFKTLIGGFVPGAAG